ncbi:MAG TPA: class I SAM-dependent methyltransferase [Oscillatoriaceae cyanobacterium]
MKPGQESETAIMVCRARAAADALGLAGFSDPTARVLLPEAARTSLDAILTAPVSKSARAGFERASLEVLAKLMVARTRAIDAAVRTAAHAQVVILGAGLDGRAWRMSELRDATVFEVDHPDTQRAKRDRVAGLAQSAREVRFVPVDFTRDDLDQALAAAGHDATRPTTWIWEGVVMYLSEAEVRATLAIVSKRSAPGSRIIIQYHRPAWRLWIVGLIVRRLGEPHRSLFTPEKMAALLAEYGFHVLADQDMGTISAELAPDLQAHVKNIRHMRLVTAERT